MRVELSRRLLLGAGLALAARPTWAFADDALEIPLWPAGTPDRLGAGLVEVVEERNRGVRPDRAVSGVARPRMFMLRAQGVQQGAQQGGAPAMLVVPGGGYQRVVIDHEGFLVGRRLAAAGITAFVLLYRLPAEGWSSGPDTPLIDAQRAMRLIRARAAALGVDGARVGVMGFSAGGHLTADLAARFAHRARPEGDAVDALSARPALAAPIYPVVAMEGPLAHAGSRAKLIGADASPALAHAHDPSRQVPADAPPHFLAHAEDDGAVPVGNSLALRAALVARGVPVETHLFPRGGHGFGLAAGRPEGAWMDLFLAFARGQGF